MLAEEVKDVNKLMWPMIASPKVDGIRCLNISGNVLARSFKPIPNVYIRETLEKLTVHGCDGELTTSDVFNQCTSDIMSRGGEPDFIYWLFDFVPGDLGVYYCDRLHALLTWWKTLDNDTRKRVRMLPFKLINSLEELKEYEEYVLGLGYEGVCLRAMQGPYKCGRSTWKERYLLKLKIFVDSEAIVLDLAEQMNNTNVSELNELGLSKRSHAASGLVPSGMLGKFIARDLKTGVEFKCGTGNGLTQDMRKEIWENKSKYIGKIFKYKYQSHGVKDKPRLPIWLGFRDRLDMDR